MRDLKPNDYFRFILKGELSMKIRRVSTQVLICFLMMLFLMVVGCVRSDDVIPAAVATYSISGVVSGDIGAGVTINLTDAATANETATTDADGTYSITGLANGGTYTLTPILAGYTFNPASKVVAITGSNMTADFVATSFTGPTYSISGKVTGVGLMGVKITLSNGSTSAEVLTDADGNYTSPSLPAGAPPYTVTPYHSGYAFTPVNISGIILSVANSTGNNFASELYAFTQADLEGTWDVHSLTAGSASGWSRADVTIDFTGALSFNNYVDSSGGSAPSGPIVWTIDTTTGVITESGVGGNPNNNYTMASNKNFIAGTLHDIGTTNPALLIAQKLVPGTVYTNADLQSKNFVFHQLNVGSSNKWLYGTGSTSSTGAINVSSQTDPSGTISPGDVGSTISVSSTGVVSMTGTGMATYNGFLSADKKTIVGIVTKGTEYHMMIIQITDGQSSTTSNIAGTSYGHMLAAGADPAPFWLHRTLSIAGGIISFHLSWVSSNSAVTAPAGTQTISIGSSGTATIIGSDFNGQLSYGGKFMVGTETFATGAFALDVITH
jgi:hypothetical protein